MPPDEGTEGNCREKRKGLIEMDFVEFAMDDAVGLLLVGEFGFHQFFGNVNREGSDLIL